MLYERDETNIKVCLYLFIMSSSKYTSILDDYRALQLDNQRLRQKSDTNVKKNQDLRRQIDELQLKLVAKQKTIDEYRVINKNQADELYKLRQQLQTQYKVNP